MTRELEERSIRRRAHTVTIDGREKMTVTGADELVSFCEEEVAIQTSMGLLMVEGEDLHIDKLNLVSFFVCTNRFKHRDFFALFFL